jgi:hydrogenase-4 membrane subunit HyfE
MKINPNSTTTAYAMMFLGLLMVISIINAVISVLGFITGLLTGWLIMNLYYTIGSVITAFLINIIGIVLNRKLERMLYEKTKLL